MSKTLLYVVAILVLWIVLIRKSVRFKKNEIEEEMEYSEENKTVISETPLTDVGVM